MIRADKINKNIFIKCIFFVVTIFTKSQTDFFVRKLKRPRNIFNNTVEVLDGEWMFGSHM